MPKSLSKADALSATKCALEVAKSCAAFVEDVPVVGNVVGLCITIISIYQKAEKHWTSMKGVPGTMKDMSDMLKLLQESVELLDDRENVKCKLESIEDQLGNLRDEMESLLRKKKGLVNALTRFCKMMAYANQITGICNKIKSDVDDATKIINTSNIAKIHDLVAEGDWKDAIGAKIILCPPLQVDSDAIKARECFQIGVKDLKDTLENTMNGKIIIYSSNCQRRDLEDFKTAKCRTLVWSGLGAPVRTTKPNGGDEEASLSFNSLVSAVAASTAMRPRSIIVCCKYGAKGLAQELAKRTNAPFVAFIDRQLQDMGHATQKLALEEILLPSMAKGQQEVQTLREEVEAFSDKHRINAGVVGYDEAAWKRAGEMPHLGGYSVETRGIFDTDLFRVRGDESKYEAGGGRPARLVGHADADCVDRIIGRIPRARRLWVKGSARHQNWPERWRGARTVVCNVCNALCEGSEYDSISRATSIDDLKAQTSGAYRKSRGRRLIWVDLAGPYDKEAMRGVNVSNHHLLIVTCEEVDWGKNWQHPERLEEYGIGPGMISNTTPTTVVEASPFYSEICLHSSEDLDNDTVKKLLIELSKLLGLALEESSGGRAAMELMEAYIGHDKRICHVRVCIWSVDALYMLQDRLLSRLSGNEGEIFTVDESKFALLYKQALMLLQDLTPHQKQRLGRYVTLSSEHMEEHLHIMAPAGAGKTFLGLHIVMQYLESWEGAHGAGRHRILIVVKNKPLALFIGNWLHQRLKAEHGHSAADRLSGLWFLTDFCKPGDDASAVNTRFKRLYEEECELVLDVDESSQDARPDAFHLTLIEEAHHIFYTSKLAEIVRPQIKNARRCVLLSDQSQVLEDTLDNGHFDMKDGKKCKVIVLAQIVRCPKRIVNAAKPFEVSSSTIPIGTDAKHAESLHTNIEGPLVKPRLFPYDESFEDEEVLYDTYARNVMKALVAINDQYKICSSDSNVAILVPNLKFQIKLETSLRKAFASYASKIKTEDESQLEPVLVLQTALDAVCYRRSGDASRSKHSICAVMTTIDEFDGLERLAVIGVGLDAPSRANAVERKAARSQLYRSITRTQLVFSLVNVLYKETEGGEGSLLAYITRLKFHQTHSDVVDPTAVETVMKVGTGDENNSNDRSKSAEQVLVNKDAESSMHSPDGDEKAIKGNPTKSEDSEPLLTGGESNNNDRSKSADQVLVNNDAESRMHSPAGDENAIKGNLTKSEDAEPLIHSPDAVENDVKRSRKVTQVPTSVFDTSGLAFDPRDYFADFQPNKDSDDNDFPWDESSVVSSTATSDIDNRAEVASTAASAMINRAEVASTATSDMNNRAELDRMIEAGDWAAVGATAALLHNNSGLFREERSATPAPTDSTDMDPNLAEELDQIVDAGDWEGVVRAAAKFERGEHSEGDSMSSDESSSRSSIGTKELRQDDGVRAEVEKLVRQVVPEEVENVDEMLLQFKGREEELIETLRTMLERSVASRQRVASRHRSKKPQEHTARPRKSENALKKKRHHKALAQEEQDALAQAEIWMRIAEEQRLGGSDANGASDAADWAISRSLSALRAAEGVEEEKA